MGLEWASVLGRVGAQWTKGGEGAWDAGSTTSHRLVRMSQSFAMSRRGGGSGGGGGLGGSDFIPVSDAEMAKLRRASCVWKYVTLGQPVGTWDKFHGDRKLRCNLCKHLWQRNQSKAARYFCQLKKCRVAQFDVLVDIWNDTDYRFDDRHHASIRAYMEEHGIRDSRAVAGGRIGADPCTAGKDDVQDVLDEMEEREGVELPGEEVVMTSCGEDPDMRKGKRAMGETDRAATRPGKRVHQSKNDEVYTADKQSVFNDKFLQWIYDSGIPFNAFRRQSWREVRKAADELPRGVQMRFPSFKEIGRDGVPEQRAKVASLLREVRESFSHSGATILSDGRKSRDSQPIVNFLAAGANGALLYATICRDSSVQETGAIVFHRWKAIIESFPAKDVIAFCTDSARNCTLPPVCSPLTPLSIRDGEFWRYVEFLILVMEPIHQLLRRMDRGGMMMSIVYEWSRHLVQLLTKLDVVRADLLTPCLREVRMQLMHLLEPAHAATHLLNPRRRSLRYYASLHTTTEDAEVVQECDHFLLAQTGGDPTSRDYLVTRDQMHRFHVRSGDWGDRLVSDAEAEGLHRDQGTHRCAAWWFAHGTAHPELHVIAIRAMHMWTSASPAERNWAAHKRIQTAKRSNLGFAKLAQLVEITTNLKLASCRQQGGGYVLPWVMEGVDTERRLPDEDEDGDPEPDVWGPDLLVSAVFGDRVATLLPFDHVPPPPFRGAGEGFAAAAEDEEDDWTDAEDVAGGIDRTVEQVYFTYGGGSDGHAPRTSVITDDVAGGAQGSATRHPPAGRGRGAVARDVHPPTRRVLGVNSSDEDEGVAPHADRLRDPRFDPSHHSREHSEQLHQSHRLAERSVQASQQPQDIPVAEGTPSHSGPAQAATSSLRTSDFDIAGSHGGSHVLRCRVHDRAEYRTDVREREEIIEERDARLDREEEARLQSMPRWEGREAYEAEQRRKRELETTGAGPPSSVGRMPTSDTMQPSSGPFDVVGGGADTCGLDAGGGGQQMCHARVVLSGVSRQWWQTRELIVPTTARNGGTHGGEEGMVDEGGVSLPEEELVDEGSVRLPQEELDEGDSALPEEELVDEGSVPLEGSVPFVDGATQDDEEGAAVDAGRNASSVRDGVT
ncbi:hypothetical protein CBR_g11951 [Chara braunii]|uniref:DUF659 domain-containing protein n=1 Tax=Chara braunii TaxID=69332 RepID=A0A388KR15_CHABU|nr:hypothetical protein CBR_g11951 [Chara braunii]|eukprot:GBG72373.1 hypothetical protein CBR_g11951 [Chara braunii]